MHHLQPTQTQAVVLAGTGPVGQRVARLLAGLGASVRVGSRQLARAEKVCEAIRARFHGASLTPVGIGNADELRKALAEQTLVVSAGAEGVQLLPKPVRAACPTLKVAIDLNAVPPLGIEGVEVADRGKPSDGVICYGAIGVGDTKMKIHKAAIARLFESNDQVLDAEECYALSDKLDDK